MKSMACHGAAAVPSEQWVNGLNPTPPYLDVAQQWNPRELEWTLRNGIKMTAMPAWRESMSDSQINGVVLSVATVSKMPPQTYLGSRTASVYAQSIRTGSILGTATAHQTAPRAATAAVR